MRVLFIHNRYRQAGGEDKALQLEKGLLDAKGHTTDVLIFDNEEIPDSLAGRIRAFMQAIYNRSSEKKIRRKIEAFTPDIIHVHNIFFVASPAVLYGATKMQVPVVMTLHNYRLICCNALLLKKGKPCEICVKRKLPAAGIRNRCYKGSAFASGMVTLVTGLHKIRHTWQTQVQQYIVLTPFAREKLMSSALGLNPLQLVIKPNFVPDEGAGLSPREKFFLFAGRLAQEKGVHTVLEAFRQMPDKHLVVAGEGPEKEILVREYQFAENIRFIGKLEDRALSDLMKKTQALVFPSIWYEGLPYVIIEAFSAGTPVIASNLGAMSTLIKDGYNGIHFKPGNAADLEDAVRRFGEDRNDLCVNARQTYLDSYHPDIHYRSIIEIYGNTIKNYDPT